MSVRIGTDLRASIGGINGVVMWFSSNNDRDSYFTSNPDKLEQGSVAGVGDPVTVYMYDGTSWITGAVGFKGNKGDKGAKGADGVNGSTPELRTNNSIVQWKYTDEPATAWRDLYDLSNIFYSNSTPTTVTLGGVEKGSTFSNRTIKQMLDDLLYAYVPHSVAFTSIPSDSIVFELGDSIASAQLIAYITKGTMDLSTVNFKMDGVLIDTSAAPENSDYVTYTHSSDVTSTTTFSVEVTDVKPTTQIKSVTYKFVNPYYCGVLNDDTITEAIIKGLTKIISDKDTMTITFVANDQLPILAYPKDWGEITSVIDNDEDEAISLFTKTEQTVNTHNNEDIDYYIYMMNDPVTTAGSTYVFLF